ncbi:hypothetical protein K458DRAFT_392487 [Lentithecium fluviatile CBS 122367]|uniref:CinY protein n=1 Tax=Lentithecium fluviatile CBS 122367 TaxID=1168545 RepID=A0A6G1IRD7_9PLEO|nr:hypothetical protein K458DRAFT_392487 [Lentithecium fluviatile CBS 122367]
MPPNMLVEILNAMSAPPRLTRYKSFSTSAILLALSSSFILTACSPFGTINGLGQNNEHEMITRVAFQCAANTKSQPPYDCFEPITLDNLAGFHVGRIPGLGDNGMVGSPDDLQPGPEDYKAHCDDADFLDVAGYPQSREVATQKLQDCVDHLRMRFGQAVRGVNRLLDANGVIIESMVDVDDKDECDHDHRGTDDNTKDMAKCVVLEGLGRALHGIQDFYAHSNWADTHNPSLPISTTNPPGLNNSLPAAFLDLRLNTSLTAADVPRQLSTGCFVLIGDDCDNRITHDDLNKDHGTVGLDGTAVGKGDTSREAVLRNFPQAVSAAVLDSRRNWVNLRAEIKRVHGEVKGNRIICALASDRPTRDCA